MKLDSTTLVGELLARRSLYKAEGRLCALIGTLAALVHCATASASPSAAPKRIALQPNVKPARESKPIRVPFPLDRLLDQAEGDLAAASILPDEKSAPPVVDTRSKFERVLRERGGAARTYLGLARCELLLGGYQAAYNAFEQASRLDPGNPDIQHEQNEAKRFLGIAHQVTDNTPAGERIIQLRDWKVGEKRLLAVLSAKESLTPGDVFDHTCLTFLEEKGNAFERLKTVFLQVGDDTGEARDVRFHLADLTGDGDPEIVAIRTFTGGSFLPSWLFAFGFKEGKLELLLPPRQSERTPWIKDLNRDGKYEIGLHYTFGMEVSRAEKLLWTDIFGWDGERLAVVNAQFPWKYEQWIEKLRPFLREHPKDYEAWKALGITYEATKRPTEALLAYRRALTLLTANAEDAVLVTPEGRKPDPVYEAMLKDLRTRIDAIR